MARPKRGLVQHLPVHGVQCVLNNVGLMRMGIIKQQDIPLENGTLSLVGGTKVSEVSTVTLCVGDAEDPKGVDSDWRKITRPS